MKKTIESFFDQLDKDSDFREYVEKLSPKELILFLKSSRITDIDWSEFLTRLWHYFPEKISKEIDDIVKNATIFENNLPLYPDHTEFDVDYLQRIFDPDKSVASIRLYNFGITQEIVIPLSGNREYIVTLKRGDSPKIAELRKGADRRFAQLVFDAAKNQPKRMRITL